MSLPYHCYKVYSDRLVFSFPKITTPEPNHLEKKIIYYKCCCRCATKGYCKKGDIGSDDSSSLETSSTERRPIYAPRQYKDTNYFVGSNLL